jgi:hypothetical protein
VYFMYFVKRNIEAETKTRMGFYKMVCNNRLSEGKFINQSLKDLRESIKIMLLIKNKLAPRLVPSFINECLSCYCPTSDECFKMNVPNLKEIEEDMNDINKEKSAIIKTIIENLEYPNEIDKNAKRIYVYENLLISIFCVFNGNRTANNPPPIPYVDINDLKQLYFHNFNKIKTETIEISYEEASQIFTRTQTPQLKMENEKYLKYLEKNKNEKNVKINKFIRLCEKARTEIYILSIVFDPDHGANPKLKDLVNSTVFTNFTKLLQDIDYDIDRLYDANRSNAKPIIENFINMVDNSNAVSAIGTLEFVDLMGKFNSVNSICNVDTFIQENTNYFQPLEDIIQKQQTSRGGNKTRKSNKETMAKKTRKNIA